ncbi:hypothetical protein [Polaromonas sp. CG9_12]|nr:hypothetical protein [Polaromonas sp. CG_9.11]MBG6076422.1 hypothetical protein [Polaromonas sp. CG_9.11]CDS50632.1 hypothetical protein [Polaromonas sp. CG9_12]
MPNAIAGPPENLAITPVETLAIVANSLNAVEETAPSSTCPTTACG